MVSKPFVKIVLGNIFLQECNYKIEIFREVLSQ
jgi:hypothetical protein